MLLAYHKDDTGNSKTFQLPSEKKLRSPSLNQDPAGYLHYTNTINATTTTLSDIISEYSKRLQTNLHSEG